jgi:transcription elongation factor Elf1
VSRELARPVVTLLPKGATQMMWISCPWCEDEALVDLLEAVEPVEAFTCEACGTSVTLTFVSESAVLDMAA